MPKIESLLKESRSFAPPKDFTSKANISLEDYESLYKRSIENPKEFWTEQAEKYIEWMVPFKNVLDWQVSQIDGGSKPYVSFFRGGILNASTNCLDRHIERGAGNKKAIIWRGENDEIREFTYEELQKEVSCFANLLRSRGVKKSSVVTIYLPMIPQAVIAALACARIGAIHSVVFSAFSPEALKSRMIDGSSETLITTTISNHAGKSIDLLSKAYEATKELENFKNLIVWKRDGGREIVNDGQSIYWQDGIKEVSDDCPPEPMDAESPLFILYTSGSTGKPKGVIHTTGGYMLYTTMTANLVFDLKPEDIYWCTADIGWITGHSYLIYGPLSNAATCFMYEGTPTYPQPDRLWQLVEEHKVSIFYTAPTAIRALMKLGDKWPNNRDLSSLRLLCTVGEPINPEAWIWYRDVIGKGKCPIVDTWWQTETGGIAITTLPGAMPTKPGAAGKPFFGIKPQIIKGDGNEANIDEGGTLTFTQPWPSMIRGVYGDKNNELLKKNYFNSFGGNKYITGDGCRKDSDGYYWLLGRIDDVINVAAHRFSTAEIESALVSHKAVAEAAVVGCPDETKGKGIYCFVMTKDGIEACESLRSDLVQHVRTEISPIATPKVIQFAKALPKTRSGKIMRRILRKIADGTADDIGDSTTLDDPTIVEDLIGESKKL